MSTRITQAASERVDEDQDQESSEEVRDGGVQIEGLQWWGGSGNKNPLYQFWCLGNSCLAASTPSAEGLGQPLMGPSRDDLGASRSSSGLHFSDGKTDHARQPLAWTLLFGLQFYPAGSSTGGHTPCRMCCACGPEAGFRPPQRQEVLCFFFSGSHLLSIYCVPSTLSDAWHKDFI